MTPEDTLSPRTEPLVPREAETGLLQIGAAAERVGLSLRTMRHWDEVGLVQPSARSKGRFRLYSEVDIERIRIVMSMKPLGLTLEEMRELLDLLEPASSHANLSDDDQARRVEVLCKYAERANERIGKLDREFAGARELQARMANQLLRYQPRVSAAVGSVPVIGE